MARILIVDDDADVADAIKLILETANGYSCSVAYGGKDALKKLKTLKPDLVLLDIMMPDLNGWDVLYRLRAEKAYEKMRVMFVSVKGKEEYEKHKDARSQYSTFITKPFGSKTLINKVN
ncbi:MAG: response regulator, partial [Candidatus Diapherotrites archaeon]|nr:response regulator [Candidatus Diapherotrites archaeon]